MPEKRREERVPTTFITIGPDEDPRSRCEALVDAILRGEAVRVTVVRDDGSTVVFETWQMAEFVSSLDRN